MPMKRQVYVISTGNSMKVGIAVDAKSRVKALQTGNGGPLTLRRVVDCPSELSARWLEKRAHEALKRYGFHLRGEWFRRDIGVANKVLNRYRKQIREPRNSG